MRLGNYQCFCSMYKQKTANILVIILLYSFCRHYQHYICHNGRDGNIDESKKIDYCIIDVFSPLLYSLLQCITTTISIINLSIGKM